MRKQAHIINSQVTSFSSLNNNDFRYLLSTSMHVNSSSRRAFHVAEIN